MKTRADRKVELRDELINILDKIKKVNPNQKIIVETVKGSLELKLSDALIYDDPNGAVVIDAE